MMVPVLTVLPIVLSVHQLLLVLLVSLYTILMLPELVFNAEPIVLPVPLP